jgi:trehalose-phosphatase
MVREDRVLSYPRHVTEEVDLLSRALGEAEHVFLFVDYGGTLVPAQAAPVVRPTGALRRRLEQLVDVDSFSVFVMSGRTVEELDALLGIDRIGLVGLRGLEIRKGDGPTRYPVSPGTAGNLLQRIELDTHGSLGEFAGVRIENRGFSLAVRLAACDPPTAKDVSQRFARLVRTLDEHHQLEVFYGGDSVEARIGGWHKGDAVGDILRDVEPDDALAIYIGDDVTDEDGFEAVRSWSADAERDMSWLFADPDEEEKPAPRAIPILVSEKPRPTRASLFVRGPREVHEFLANLAAVARTLL